jgi:hypothetical protein
MIGMGSRMAQNDKEKQALSALRVHCENEKKKQVRMTKSEGKG